MAEGPDLKQTCQHINEALERLNTGIFNVKENTSQEEEILKLKEIVEFIESKLKVLKVSNTSDIRKNYTEADINRKKLELINKLQRSQNIDSVCNNVLTTHTLKCLKHSSNVAFQTYKEKIIEQLERMKNNCTIIRELRIRQQQELHESINLFTNYKNQVAISEILKDRKEAYDKENQKNESEAYKARMDKVQERLIKINFMRVLINRLFIYDPTTKNNKKDPKYKQIFKNNRHLVTMDSLLKD